MQTALHTALVYQPKASLLNRFLTWCTNQEKDRLLWTGIALAVQGCILAPVSLMVIAFASNLFILWTIPLICLVMNLVVHLAALPTRYTVPVFFISLLLNIAVIIAALL